MPPHGGLPASLGEPSYADEVEPGGTPAASDFVEPVGRPVASSGGGFA